jgi:hypothetical protein
LSGGHVIAAIIERCEVYQIFGPVSPKVIGFSLNALLPICKCEKLIFIDSNAVS